MPVEGEPVGYGNPPVATRFQKGQSGNPMGRPPKSLSKRAIVERVLTEKQRLNNQPKGERVHYTRLELIIMLVKQMAASGHHQATKLFTSVMEKYGRQEPDNRVTSYLVVPERLTKEEWVAKYSPKDKPPDYGS
jgi:predicted transcriptional regulator of viral defense system